MLRGMPFFADRRGFENIDVPFLANTSTQKAYTISCFIPNQSSEYTRSTPIGPRDVEGQTQTL